MLNSEQFRECWVDCEYFLGQDTGGINLRSFDLICEVHCTSGTRDAYVYEQLTRRVLARNARGIKRFARNAVENDRLGLIETMARSMSGSFKSNLYDKIKARLDAELAISFSHRMTATDAPEALLVLASFYYAYYKNREIPGYWAAPFYFDVFMPFLMKSQRGDIQKVAHLEAVLMDRFTLAWENTRGNYDLTSFFEDQVTRKTISWAFASILSFLREEREKAVYLFEVVNGLTTVQMDLFRLQLTNGLNTVMDKPKRLVPKSVDGNGANRLKRLGSIPEEQVHAVVDQVVDVYFDRGLDCIVNYYLSLEDEKPKRNLAKLFDRTFVRLNRQLWKDIMTLVDTQRRVAYRRQYLLRVVIHYMFEMRDVDRELWKKYIPSVRRVVRYTYKENRRKLKEFNAILGAHISPYRKLRQYQGTDWEGFYNDSHSRAVAKQVLQDIVNKAGAGAGMPAIWFSTQVEKGVDYQILYRFFRQGAQAF
ncbi:MAG: hypothetical protein MI802_04420 [Desulfobacterales bacterium]|nr:hypothetical protein [Desulfobacterales bacterium]